MADEVAQTESWTLPTLCQDTCSGSQPPCLEQNDTKWLQCFSKTKENKAAIFDHHLLMEVLQHWFWDTSKFPNFVHRDKPQEWSVSRSCFASFTWCGGQLLVGLTCPNRIWLGYRVARSRGGYHQDTVDGKPEIRETHQLMLVVHPMIYRVWDTSPGGFLGFLPSTVSWYHDLLCFFLGWWWFLGPEGARWVRKDMSWPR